MPSIFDALLEALQAVVGLAAGLEDEVHNDLVGHADAFALLEPLGSGFEGRLVAEHEKRPPD
jgi:hypothetical protein